MDESTWENDSYFSEAETMSTCSDAGSSDDDYGNFDDEDYYVSPASKLNFCSVKMVEEKMEGVVGETSGLLNVLPSTAHVLLRNYKWEQSELVSNFLDKKEVILEKCGVHSMEIATKPPVICDICCCDVPPDRFFSLDCSHIYCKDCWRRHVETEMKKGPDVCLRSTCMHPECQQVITEDTVKYLAPELLPKYRDFQVRSYIKSNKLMRWCPGAGCERVAVSGKFSGTSTGFGFVTCACSTEFCMDCGEPTHGPVNCALLKKWQIKCVDESESVSWILVNTKQCPNPNCSVHIEKNQGCNHMTCKICNHEFCWICMGDWKGHKACKKEIKTEKKVIAKELDRYIYCYNHYDAQSKSQEAAEEQLKKLDHRKHSYEHEVLRKALSKLVECRNILKFTYAGLYYSTMSEAEKDLFEFQRDDLSANTEKLSEMTENPSSYDLNDINSQVNVVDRIVNHYKKNIIFC